MEAALSSSHAMCMDRSHGVSESGSKYYFSWNNKCRVAWRLRTFAAMSSAWRISEATASRLVSTSASVKSKSASEATLRAF